MSSAPRAARRPHVDVSTRGCPTPDGGASNQGLRLRFLTVVAQQAAKAELLFTIPPQAFNPRPKVHAAMVRLVPLGRDEPPVGDYEVFRAVVRGLLTHRRKNISNNIKHLGSRLVGGSSIRRGLAEMGIDPSRRAETLSVEEFAALSHFCASPP